MKETKTVYTKADGTTITREVITDRATGNNKTITTTVKNGKTSVVETTHLENGLTKSVHKGVDDRLNKVEYHDRYGNPVKTTFEDPRLIGSELFRQEKKVELKPDLFSYFYIYPYFLSTTACAAASLA